MLEEFDEDIDKVAQYCNNPNNPNPFISKKDKSHLQSQSSLLDNAPDPYLSHVDQLRALVKNENRII